MVKIQILIQQVWGGPESLHLWSVLQGCWHCSVLELNRILRVIHPWNSTVWLKNHVLLFLNILLTSEESLIMSRFVPFKNWLLMAMSFFFFLTAKHRIAHKPHSKPKTSDIFEAEFANDLKSKVKVGGIIILSGILTKYRNRIINAFSEFELVENLTQNEWESFVFKNQGK